MPFGGTMRRRLLLLSLVACLAIPGCIPILLDFDAPTVVGPGRTFEIVFTGQLSPNYGHAVCAVQIPNGFVVEGAINTIGESMARDFAPTMSAYTVEPGHYLATWMAGNLPHYGPIALKLILRAPASPGAFTFKVSLGRLDSGPTVTVAPTSPSNLTNFAQISGIHARTVAVVPGVTTPFERRSQGLPASSYDLWHGLAATDLDGDGDDDLVAGARDDQYAPTGLFAFRSNPGGPWSFAHGGLPSLPPIPGTVAVGDFDRDGFGDVADGSGRVWFGGPVGFTQGPPITLPGPMATVAVGDIDGDGIDDVAFGGAGRESVLVWRSNGNRTFTPASTGLPNSGAPTAEATDLLLQDVTGDGHVDVVWIHSANPRVWIGNGAGSWALGSGFVGTGLRRVVAGDLDGDGQVELVCSTSATGVGCLRVFRHLGGNTWALASVTGLPALDSSEGVTLLDHDHDGLLDIAATTAAPWRVRLWRNVGGLQFSEVSDTGLPRVCLQKANAIVAGDFNGDTFPDLAVAIEREGIVVFENALGGLSRYGAACSSAPFAAPSITANGAPTLGSATFALQLAGGAPAGVGFVVAGASKTFWNGVPLLPLDLGPLGAPGCRLLAEPQVSSLITLDAAGAAVLPLPIPPTPSLQLQTFFAQVAVVRPTVNTLGLLFSDGLAIRIE